MGTNCLSRFLPKMAAASRFPPKVSAVPRFAPKLVCISHRRKTFPNSKISMLMKLPAFNTNLHGKKINLKNFVIKTMCLNNCIYTHGCTQAQGSHAPWKTWKVKESVYNFIFKGLKVLKLKFGSWKSNILSENKKRKKVEIITDESGNRF